MGAHGAKVSGGYRQGRPGYVRQVAGERCQDKIAAMLESDLVMLHMGLGQWIRNTMGLWQGNIRLLAATGERDPDDASGVIIQAFWQGLQDERPKVH